MKDLLAILRLFWRGDRRRFMLGIALSFATILAGTALLGLSGWFITASAVAGVAGAGLTFDFFRPSAGIRFLALARTAGRYGERLLSHDATLKFLALVRVRLFRSIAAADFLSIGRFRSGEVLARLTADVDYLDNVYLRLFLPALAALVSLALVTLGLSLLDLRLGLAVGGIVVVASVALLVAGAVAGMRPARRQTFAREAIRVRAVDLSRGQTELLFAGRLASQRQAVLDAHEKAEDAGERLNRIDSLQMAGFLLTGQAALAAVLLIGAPLVVSGRITAAELATALLVALGAIEAVTPVGRGALVLGRTLLAARRIMPLVRRQSADRDVPPLGSVPAARPSTPELLVDDVSFRWSTGRTIVLDRVSLAVMPGERVALQGESGSGKSTLLALAGGLHAPTEGRVFFRGLDLAESGSGAARGMIGFLPQASAVFADTIAGNLRLADPDAADQELWRALEIAGLAETIRALPKGLDTLLGEGGQGLSGGQLRRLSLARLVLRRPAVFLLDEPTEGMGGALGLTVLHRLFAACPDAAFLYATHQEEEAALADRTIRFGKGRISRSN